ncbi:MAG: RHS repeat protein [Bacteroidales bacterium]|nr:RHS repeat protein [Bacteroidales bacterium]
MGKATSVEDPGGNRLDYTYFSSGDFKTISGNGGTLLYYYNEAGLDTTFSDPSLGDIRKRYNALGQLTWIQDGNGNSFEFTYDTLNRITRKENADNASEYYTISYVASGNGKGQVSSKSYTDGSLTTTLTYTYDAMGRIRSESKQTGSRTYTQWYRYDEAGRLDSVTNSEGKQFDYRYDERSYLTKIYFEDELIWELEQLDLTERTENYGSNITVTSCFDSYGNLSAIDAGNLFNMSYTFNPVTGNLTSRTQKIYNLAGTCTDTLTESFTYDDLDRLKESTSPGDEPDVEYDQVINERIRSKSDAGRVYNYNASKPFQLKSIDSATSELLNRPEQAITYTSFNPPSCAAF